jgi:hypothetical protein
MSSVELRRILAEWRLRMQRVKDILQPPRWTEKEWRQFSQALALLVRDHGRSWIIDPNVYWDLRWKLQDGGELVCQVEHIPEQKTSLVVAQTGGFASEVGSYTWLWAEFNLEGEFARDPYWVDGSWRDALTALLLPLDRQSSYMLAGRSETPQALLLQEGARPNDGHVTLALPAGFSEESSPKATASETPVQVSPAEPASTAELSPEPAVATSIPESKSVEAAPSPPPAGGPRIEAPPADAQPTTIPVEDEESVESYLARNGDALTEDNGALLAEKANGHETNSAEEQARFRRLRAKAHFAESLRRVPPVNRYRSH